MEQDCTGWQIARKRPFDGRFRPLVAASRALTHSCEGISPVMSDVLLTREMRDERYLAFRDKTGRPWPSCVRSWPAGDWNPPRPPESGSPTFRESWRALDRWRREAPEFLRRRGHYRGNPATWVLREREASLPREKA